MIGIHLFLPFETLACRPGPTLVAVLRTGQPFDKNVDVEISDARKAGQVAVLGRANVTAANAAQIITELRPTARCMKKSPRTKRLKNGRVWIAARTEFLFATGSVKPTLRPRLQRQNDGV
jgi:hypothetical protein